VASIFNKYSGALKPLLGGGLFGDWMKNLKNTISNQFKEEKQAGSQWIMGEMSTEDFVKNIISSIKEQVKTKLPFKF